MRIALAVAAAGLIGAWLLALTVCDLREHRLPNVLTIPGAGAVLVGAALTGRGPAALTGAGLLAGCYLLVHLIAPAGMGAGDVKLAVGLGALTGAFGAPSWMLAALGAPVLTALAGLCLRRRALPHGPAMCAASATAVLLAL